MANNDENIIKKINEQKIELNKWKIYLASNISKNTYKKDYLLLVEEEWIRNYQKKILDKEINDKNKKDIIKDYQKCSDINNDKLMDVYSDEKINLSKLKKVSVLNYTTWKSIQKEAGKTTPTKLVSTFCNKILIITLNKTNYCFFFFDLNNQLRQGYIKINDIYADIIINQLQYKSIYFILGYEKEIKNSNKYIKEGKLTIPTDKINIEAKNKFEILIFSYEKKKEEKNMNYNDIIKDEREKKEKQKNNIIVINPNTKKQVNLNNNQSTNPNNTQNNNQNNQNNQKDIQISNKIIDKFQTSMESRGRLNSRYAVPLPANDIYKEIEHIKEQAKEKKRKEEEERKRKEEEERKRKEEEEKKSKVNVVDIKQGEKKKEIINKLNPQTYIVPSSKQKIYKEFNNEKNLTKSTREINTYEKIEVYTPGLIGLLNVGATCYMNSTLQCFSNIMTLREILLNEKIYNYIENNKTTKKLSFEFAEVLNNLWKNIKNSYYAPQNFKEIISEMNPLFKGVAANDPKDLILFLLETMHNELNQPQPELLKTIKNTVPDQRDFNAVFSDFIFFYLSKNKSIISDEFYGFSNNMVTCSCCSTTTHNVQVVNILFMPLEEVRLYMGYNTNYVGINDCFEYYEKIDVLPDYYCNYCRNSNNVYSKNKMVYAPKNLIINLNRGRGIEFNVNIKFDEYLDIKKYVFAFDSPFYYELTGVVCHFGSNDMGGHFIAFCKNSNTCEWYKFNDQMVTKCTFNDVTKSGMPYVLFYSYIQVDDELTD